MNKLRYGAMAVAVVMGVGGFLLAQRLDVVPGPWSRDRPSLVYSARAMLNGPPDDAQDYMLYYRRGVHLAEQRQLARALTELDNAVRRVPVPLSLAALGDRASDSRVPETHTLHKVVLVHTARADILQRMNRPLEALADLDQALAFDNRKMDTFYQRAMLRMATGQYQNAVSDFDVVLNRRNNVQWSFGRGVAKYLQSDWTGAIKDFEDAARGAPSTDTYRIWLAKTYLRAGVRIPPELFAALGDARYVIEAFMSDHNPAQLLSGIRAGAAYVERRRHSVKCETALFMGEWLILRKKGAGARDMFREAMASCRPLSVESAVATAELQRLKP